MKNKNMHFSLYIQFLLYFMSTSPDNLMEVVVRWSGHVSRYGRADAFPTVKNQEGSIPILLNLLLLLLLR